MKAEAMKLWYLRPGDRFKFHHDGATFTFRGMDGMYAKCEASDGNVYPMASNEPVLVITAPGEQGGPNDEG